MRKDLKERLIERLNDGPMQFNLLTQIEAVVNLVEEVVDNDNDRGGEYRPFGVAEDGIE